MRVLFSVIFALFVATGYAQDFDAIFASDVPDNVTGVTWATADGGTVTINGVQYPTAKHNSKAADLVVLGKQSFLYFAPGQVVDGELKPVGEHQGFPVFKSHTGKFWKLVIGPKGPYAKWGAK